jgi:hypothetical protein
MRLGVATDHINNSNCMGVVWHPLGYVAPHPEKDKWMVESYYGIENNCKLVDF